MSKVIIICQQIGIMGSMSIFTTLIIDFSREKKAVSWTQLLKSPVKAQKSTQTNVI
jgi:hypothetical protein